MSTNQFNLLNSFIIIIWVVIFNENMGIFYPVNYTVMKIQERILPEGVFADESWIILSP